MTTAVEVSQTEVRLVAEGPLYSLDASEFEEKLESTLLMRFATVTLDLSKATAICSDSIGKILFVRKKLADQGRSFRIQGCGEKVLATFKMMQLDQLLEIQ